MLTTTSPTNKIVVDQVNATETVSQSVRWVMLLCYVRRLKYYIPANLEKQKKELEVLCQELEINGQG